MMRFAFLALLPGLLAPVFAAKPNIVLIMADDLGYECVGANGGASYQTPVLDSMAKEGMRFEHCYSQPLCTPSRVKLMTGISNIRNYIKFGLLDPKATTFAQLLKKEGYATVWWESGSCWVVWRVRTTSVSMSTVSGSSTVAPAALPTRAWK